MLCAEGKSFLGIPQCFSFCDRSMVTNFSFLPKLSNYKYTNIFQISSKFYVDDQLLSETLPTENHFYISHS